MPTPSTPSSVYTFESPDPALNIAFVERRLAKHPHLAIAENIQGGIRLKIRASGPLSSPERLTQFIDGAFSGKFRLVEQRPKNVDDEGIAEKPTVPYEAVV